MSGWADDIEYFAEYLGDPNIQVAQDMRKFATEMKERIAG